MFYNQIVKRIYQKLELKGRRRYPCTVKSVPMRLMPKPILVKPPVLLINNQISYLEVF